MNSHSLLSLSLLSLGALSACGAEPVGYTDTPMIPGQPWHVHDINRPQPRVVVPGTTFSESAPAPSDATVLFDGHNLDQWACTNGAVRWKVENGYMEVVPKTGSVQTKEEFGDFQLHIEWASPVKVEKSSQGRGNSGIFLHGRFEIQVLDTFENRTYADGTAGGLYGQWPPLVNAVRPPGAWQTYDIIFEAPHFDEKGGVTKKACVTVIRNGVVLHHRKELIGETVHREVGVYRPYSGRGPILLQDHGDLVRYRNIWIRPLGEYDQD